MPLSVCNINTLKTAKYNLDITRLYNLYMASDRCSPTYLMLLSKLAPTRYRHTSLS